MFNNSKNTNWFSGWQYCVSTATSFLATAWTEHFFTTEEEANEFRNAAEKAGYVTLKVTPDEY